MKVGRKKNVVMLSRDGGLCAGSIVGRSQRPDMGRLWRRSATSGGSLYSRGRPDLATDFHREGALGVPQRLC